MILIIIIGTLGTTTNSHSQQHTPTFHGPDRSTPWHCKRTSPLPSLLSRKNPRNAPQNDTRNFVIGPRSSYFAFHSFTTPLPRLPRLPRTGGAPPPHT